MALPPFAQPLSCSLGRRSDCSEAATAPSDSRDESAAAVAAAAAAAEAALSPRDEDCCCGGGVSSKKSSSSSSSSSVCGGGRVPSTCVVGVESPVSVEEGPPICQAKAASTEGPLGGPSPPPPRRLQSGYVPYNPYGLSRLARQLLELTELPFMILWIYFAYFLVIVALTAHKVRSRVWLSALVAGTLVGIGLNANAYRAIMYRGYPDVGIIVRFFLIPFGVSALSGLTHSLREDFLLVFPVDPVELLIALTAPTVVVCSLMLGRVVLLHRLRVPITLRNFLLNGNIYS
ncbi:hypothetical protein, conserved [Eimeria necatrix]|uniref:Transmembrane protein n=1 Tax=Eimeria necatrix TaxID=51315 RepID=U6MRZ7_9EIME|nr:hypothetical protein, conserved [Eimeria necatrix]CDJ65863.1 hypothetical protein, conserved [Eimeria necatrix]